MGKQGGHSDVYYNVAFALMVIYLAVIYLKMNRMIWLEDKEGIEYCPRKYFNVEALHKFHRKRKPYTNRH